MLLLRHSVFAITRRTNLVSRRLGSSQTAPACTPRSRTLLQKSLYATFISLGVVGVAVVSPMGTVHADEPQEGVNKPLRKESLGSLLRAYVVYSVCSIPPIVDASPAVLSFCQSVPGLKQLTESIVRVTFFDQFVGGDTAEQVIPLLEDLRARNTGALFAYSVEEDDTSPSKGAVAQYRLNVEEMMHSIDVAAEFEDRYASKTGVQAAKDRKTWVALKLTALLPSADSLVRLSKHLLATRPRDELVHYPGTPRSSDLDVLLPASPPPANSPLTQEDIAALRTLHEDLRRICTKAKTKNVKIIIDAEYTWQQAAIDAFQLSLMREFNAVPKKRLWGSTSSLDQVQSLVYGTYQAYLRRNTMHLLRSLETAERDRFVLGVKLVRGAYHDREKDITPPYQPNTSLIQRRMASVPGDSTESLKLPEHGMGSLPSVWQEKWETDGAYNAAAMLLVDLLRRKEAPVAILFGTHNKESCDMIIRSLVSRGLAKSENGTSRVRVNDQIVDRLAFGQLYGMSDALTEYLTNTLVASSPVILKYIPYGSLESVIPYLGRRAIENKSVLGAAEGGAADERRRAGKELWRRVMGGK